MQSKKYKQDKYANQPKNPMTTEYGRGHLTMSPPFVDPEKEGIKVVHIKIRY